MRVRDKGSEEREDREEHVIACFVLAQMRKTKLRDKPEPGHQRS